MLAVRRLIVFASIASLMNAYVPAAGAVSPPVATPLLRFTEEALSGRFLSAHQIIPSSIGTLIASPARLLQNFRGVTVTAPPEDQNEAISRAALDALQFLFDLPFFNVGIWISTLRPQELIELINFYHQSYRELTHGDAPGLPPAMRQEWERILRQVTGYKRVRIISDAHVHRLAIDQDGELLVKDTLLAFLGIDTAARNRILSWILARRLTHIWMQQHPGHVITRAALAQSRFQSPGRSEWEHAEFAATLISILPFGRYDQLRQKTKLLMQVPNVRIDVILHQFRRYHPRESDALIRWAYDQAQKTYAQKEFPSGESFFTHATRVALSVARLHGDARTIASNLLHVMDPEKIRKLDPPAIEDAGAALECIYQLTYVLQKDEEEPFKPPVILNRPDAGPEAALRRQIRRIDGLAREIVPNLDRPTLRKIRASIYMSMLANILQTAATLGPGSDPAFAEKIRARLELLDGPQARRLLLDQTADHIQDQLFRIFEPKKRAQISASQRMFLGMTQDQARKFMFSVETHAANIISGFGVQPILMQGTEKRYRDTDGQLSRRRLEDPNASIGDQTDLLSLLIVVETEDDLKKLEGLDLLLGVRGRPPYGWRRFMSAWTQKRFKYDIRTIQIEHPHDPRKLLTVEIPILTRAAYEDYLTLRHEQDYSQPRYQSDLRRAADNYARRQGSGESPWILEFDFKDPPLQMTGDLLADLEENLERIAQDDDRVYALFPVKESAHHIDVGAIDAPNVGDLFWDTIALPSNARAADWVFSRAIAGSPEQHRFPLQVRLIQGQPHDETTALAVDPLSIDVLNLDQALHPTPVLMLANDSGEPLSKDEQRHLIMQVQSGRAAFLLTDTRTRRARQEIGEKALEVAFGQRWASLRKRFLPPLAEALDFLTSDELVQAIGISLVSIDRVMAIFWRTHTRIDSQIAETPSTFQITITTDQPQIGFFNRFLTMASGQEWNLTASTEVQEDFAQRTAVCHVEIKKLGQTKEEVSRLLKTIRVARSYQSWKGVLKERSVRIRMAANTQTLTAVTAKFAECGVNIRAIRPVIDAHKGTSTWTFEFDLAGPDSERAPSPFLPANILKAVLPITEELRDYVNFVFTSYASNGSTHIVFTNDETQLGVLAEVATMIAAQKWDLTGNVRQIETGKGRSTNLQIRPRPEAGDLNSLLQTLRKIRRIRGERQPAKEGQWISIHVGVHNSDGAITQIARTLTDQEISIVAVNNDADLPGWFDLVVYAPDGVTVDGMRDILERSIPNSIAEVTYMEISEATAERISAIQADRMARFPDGLKNFIPFKPKEHERRGPVDEEYVNMYEKAIAFADRYHGYYPHGEPADGKVTSPQFRKIDGNLPYVIHPLEVANRFSNRYQGRDELFNIVAILHDVIEDAPKYIYKYYADLFARDRAEAIQKLIRRFPELTEKLERAQTLPDLSSLKKDITLAGKQEILRAIETEFPDFHHRLKIVLDAYDHAGRSFAESIAKLSGKDLADFFGVKGSDQVVNLLTAYAVDLLRAIKKSGPDLLLVRTLGKNIRHVLTAMMGDTSRRTSVYWESQRDLFSTVIFEAENAVHLHPFYNEDEDRDSAHEDMLKSISEVLRYMSDHPDLLPDQGRHPAIHRFELKLRDLAKQLAQLLIAKKRLSASTAAERNHKYSPITEDTVLTLNKFLISEARLETNRPSWADDLPIHPDSPEARDIMNRPIIGEVDQEFVSQFKKIWWIARQYHNGDALEGESPLATQQIRRDGSAVMTHLWTLTWNMLNAAKFRDQRILRALTLHDLLEDVSTLTSHELLPVEIQNRFIRDFPENIANELYTDITIFTKDDLKQTQLGYITKIKQADGADFPSAKLIDIASSLIGREPSDPYKAICSGLDLVADEKNAGSAPYIAARIFFLNALIQRVLSIDNALSIPDYVTWDWPKSEEAKHLATVLNEFFAWSTRHPEVAQGLPDWTLFMADLHAFHDHAEKINSPRFQSLNLLLEAATLTARVNAFSGALQIIQQIAGDAAQTIFFVQTLDAYLISQKDQELLSLVRQLRERSIHEAILKHIRNRGWRERSSHLSVNHQETTAIAIMDTEKKTHYLSLGPIEIVNRDFVSPSIMSLVRDELIVFVDGPIDFAPHLLPVLGLMLEHRSEFKGSTVREDGMGRGALGLLALRMGASFLVGFDANTEDLKTVEQILLQTTSPEGESHRGALLDAKQWKTYIPKVHDRYILIMDDLQNWYDAPSSIRDRILGTRKIIHLANIGPVYQPIYGRLLADLLDYPSAFLTILGGFRINSETNSYSYVETLQYLTKALWSVTVKKYTAKNNRPTNTFFGLAATLRKAA